MHTKFLLPIILSLIPFSEALAGYCKVVSAPSSHQKVTIKLGNLGVLLTIDKGDKVIRNSSDYILMDSHTYQASECNKKTGGYFQYTNGLPYKLFRIVPFKETGSGLLNAFHSIKVHNQLIVYKEDDSTRPYLLINTMKGTYLAYPLDYKLLTTGEQERKLKELAKSISTPFFNETNADRD